MLHQPKLWPAAPIGPAKAMLLPEADAAADRGRGTPGCAATDAGIDVVTAQAGSTAESHGSDDGSSHVSMQCDVKPPEKAASEARASASPCPKASTAAGTNAALPTKDPTYYTSADAMPSLHRQEQQQATGDQRGRVVWMWFHAAAYQDSCLALQAAATAITAVELPSRTRQAPNHAATPAPTAQLPLDTAAASDLSDVPTAMEVSEPTAAQRPPSSDAEPRPPSPVAAMDITYPSAPTQSVSQPNEAAPPPLPMPHPPPSPVTGQLACQPVTASELPSSTLAASRNSFPVAAGSPVAQEAASVASGKDAIVGSSGLHADDTEQQVRPGMEGPATPACNSPEVTPVLLRPLHDRLRRLELRGPSAPAVLASQLLPDQLSSQLKAAPLLRATALTGSAVALMARDRRLIMRSDSTPASEPQQQIAPATEPTTVAGDIGSAHPGVPKVQSRGATADAADRGNACGAGFTEATAWQLLQQESPYPFPFSQQEVTLAFALASSRSQINSNNSTPSFDVSQSMCLFLLHASRQISVDNSHSDCQSEAPCTQ